MKTKGENVCKALSASLAQSKCSIKLSYLNFLLSVKGLWIHFPKVHLNMALVFSYLVDACVSIDLSCHVKIRPNLPLGKYP